MFFARFSLNNIKNTSEKKSRKIFFKIEENPLLSALSQNLCKNFAHFFPVFLPEFFFAPAYILESREKNNVLLIILKFINFRSFWKFCSDFFWLQWGPTKRPVSFWIKVFFQKQNFFANFIRSEAVLLDVPACNFLTIYEEIVGTAVYFSAYFIILLHDRVFFSKQFFTNPTEKKNNKKNS